VATGYVVLVFGLAGLGFLLWQGRGIDRAVEVTVAILVVACPCALGLAVPMAHELMHLALRRRGVLLRRNEFLDRALTVRKVLFDKTGTLTLGTLSLTPSSRDALDALDETDHLALATLAAQSNHPASRAVRDALGGRALAIAPHPVRETPGEGVETAFGSHVYRLGQPAFTRGGRVAARSEEDGSRTTGFSRDGIERARFRLTEWVKEDAAEEIAALEEAGYEIHLLSGDGPARVEAVGRALGVSPARTRAGLSPQEKADRVRELDEGDTLMVGDGLNDGPALAAAACAATPTREHPTLPERSDFVFLGDEIGAVRRALLAARHLRRVVRGNLAAAVAYNAIALSLCYAGVVTPVVAAILMPVSSVTLVGLTAWRLSGRRLAWMS
jgi:Cu2+-exporting ATPase